MRQNWYTQTDHARWRLLHIIQRIKRQIQEENALFKRNKQAIIHYNKRTLHVILVSGMVVFALLALSGFLPGNETYRRWEFLWGIAACALMLLLIHRTQVGQHVWALYAVQAIHVSYCVYSSTIIWPNYLCVTFLACLLMHSLLYLDKGWRVCLATALASILYCVCVSLAKTPALARDEFTNVACFYALGTLIGAFARRARLNMIDMEQQLRISEEQYRIVLLQSGNIMCRYNLSDKSISIPPELAEQLGIPSLISNAPYAPVRSGDISDDTADVYINFFERILAGNKTGAATFQMRLPTGWSWLKATFTTIFSDDGDPVYAVLSFIDVTEQRKKELAYEKWMQEVAAMSSEKTALFEWDLTHDMSEGGNGELYDYFKDQANETFNARTAKYAACHVYAKDRPAYLAFLNREQMLGAYHEGINHAEMDFREIRKTGGYRWMHIAVQLVPYPDTGGVKAFIIIRDIDEERRALLATQTQARQDALTGLLNRSAFHEETVALLDSKLEGALHAFFDARYRRLQAGQRHLRPRRRGRTACGGGQHAAFAAAPRRRHRPSRRRRILRLHAQRPKPRQHRIPRTGAQQGAAPLALARSRNLRIHRHRALPQRRRNLRGSLSKG